MVILSNIGSLRQPGVNETLSQNKRTAKFNQGKEEKRKEVKILQEKGRDSWP